MNDIGLTHVALTVSDIGRSIDFYARYAGMEVIHRRTDATAGVEVVWLSDRTRPFAIVLIRSEPVRTVVSPISHLGVGCRSREEMDTLCERAREEGILVSEPTDSGYPVGYWAFLRDPDGHTLELSHGQEIGLTVEKLSPEEKENNK